MANKAQANLAALNNLFGDLSKAQSADVALNRAESMREQRQGVQLSEKESREKARFATPEAIATGIGASILFGPFAGVVLGAAQGFLGQKAEQNVLDQIASEKNLLTDGRAIVQGRIDELRQAPNMSNEDLQTLDNAQADLDFAFRSGDRSGMESALTTITNMVTTNEQQRIAAETVDAQNESLIGREAYQNYKDIYADYNADMAPVELVSRLAGTAREAITQQSPGQLAAIINFRKALDPTSAVMEGEVKGTGQIRSAIGVMESLEAKLRDGSLLSRPEQEALIKAFDTVEDGYLVEGRRKQEAAHLRLNTAGLDDARWGDRFTQNFRVLDKLPARTRMREAEKANDRNDDNGIDANSNTPITDAFTKEAARQASLASSFIDDLASGSLMDRVTESVSDWYSGSGRDSRLEDINDYRRSQGLSTYERAPDGTLREAKSGALPTNSH